LFSTEASCEFSLDEGGHFPGLTGVATLEESNDIPVAIRNFYGLPETIPQVLVYA